MSSDRGLLASNQSRRLNGDWPANEIPPLEFECAYRGNRVGSTRGFVIRGHAKIFVAICYLTVQQAAELMGIHRITVWRLVRAGKLQTYQSEINRRVKLVKRADLEEMMRSRPLAGDEEMRVPGGVQGSVEEH